MEYVQIVCNIAVLGVFFYWVWWGATGAFISKKEAKRLISDRYSSYSNLSLLPISTIHGPSVPHHSIASFSLSNVRSYCSRNLSFGIWQLELPFLFFIPAIIPYRCSFCNNAITVLRDMQ